MGRVRSDVDVSFPVRVASDKDPVADRPGFCVHREKFRGRGNGVCIYDYGYMRVRVCIVPRVANTEFDRGQTQPTCFYICQLPSPFCLLVPIVFRVKF